MSEFIIIAQDRRAKMFHIFKDGVFKIASFKSPANIAQELLEHGDAVASDRLEGRNMANFPLFNWSIGAAALHSDVKAEKAQEKFKHSAHLPPEPINAGGDVFSPSSPATSFSNERGFLGS